MNNQAFSKIWIVIILIVFIAGGILAYQYWWVPQEEVRAPEIKVSEKIPEELVEVNIYFCNDELYKKLEQELCPGDYCPGEMYKVYGMDDCNPFFPVKRNIPEPETDSELVRLVLRELAKGPTEEETVQGFEKPSVFVGMIKEEEFEIENGILRLKLDEEKFEEWEKIIAPRSLGSLASCEWGLYFHQINFTFEQIPGIKKVEIDFCSADPNFCF